MQARLVMGLERPFPLKGSFSALGEHPFADACQHKERHLANATSQKHEFHAPLCVETTLSAVLLVALIARLQQALPPGAGRQRIPKHPPIMYNGWGEIFNSGTPFRVASRMRARALRLQLLCQSLDGWEFCTSVHIFSCHLAGLHSTSPFLGIQKMSSGSSLISHGVWQ